MLTASLLCLLGILPLSRGFSPLGLHRHSLSGILHRLAIGASVFAEDEEFRGIAERYLRSKYKGCVAGECRFVCDRDEIRAVLRSVLPPVSPEELEREVGATMARFGSAEVVEEQAFLSAFIENAYWGRAGPLVIKELIYLDCLQSFYSSGEKLLEDEDYKELKDMLAWEGSVAVTLSSKEARFLSGVSAYRRGDPVMTDDEYERLKNELQAEKSWIVSRVQDPLEKLGLDTFLGYLHAEMSKK